MPSGYHVGLSHPKKRCQARLQRRGGWETSICEPLHLGEGNNVATGAFRVLGIAAAAPSWYLLMAGKRGQTGSLLTVCTREKTPVISSGAHLS